MTLQALWEVLIAADQKCAGSDKGDCDTGGTAESGASTGGWHATTVIRDSPLNWWPPMASWLRPCMVDPEAVDAPLPPSPGGPAALGTSCGDLHATGTRVLIFLPPRHHLLLRIWAEADDGGVLVHSATDFWPVLYFLDGWLAHGEDLRKREKQPIP